MSEERTSRRVGPVLWAILLIVLLVVGWHLVFPLLGLTFAITGTIFAVVVASVVVLSVCAILFFVFSGAGVFALGGVAILWAIIAIALFPIIFPVLVPVVIVLLLIGLLSRWRS